MRRLLSARPTPCATCTMCVCVCPGRREVGAGKLAPGTPAHRSGVTPQPDPRNAALAQVGTWELESLGLHGDDVLLAVAS
jgi:hypothetical protein